MKKEESSLGGNIGETNNSPHEPYEVSVSRSVKETLADLFDRGIRMFSEDYLVDGLPKSMPSERVDLEIEIGRNKNKTAKKTHSECKIYGKREKG